MDRAVAEAEMRRVLGGAATLALAAGAAEAQTIRPYQPFGLHDAARMEQQRLGDQLQLQALTAAQARLRTQQTLQGLELARPLAPVVPENYPASSGVRRRPAAEQPGRPAAPSAEPTSPGSPADAGTRGDLPL